jgi:hypothetical protein
MIESEEPSEEILMKSNSDRAGLSSLLLDEPCVEELQVPVDSVPVFL